MRWVTLSDAKRKMYFLLTGTVDLAFCQSNSLGVEAFFDKNSFAELLAPPL
jgi:hypothetical protein